MQAYIQGRNVNLTFRPPNRGPVRALHNFDIDIEEGEFLSIVGPSGCGKSTFLNVLLGCGTFHPGSDNSPNIAGFCDKTIQDKMNAALALSVTDPAAANKEWAVIERMMADQSPVAVLFTPKYIDFLSKRVKNYVFNAQYYWGQTSSWIQ